MIINLSINYHIFWADKFNYYLNSLFEQFFENSYLRMRY